MFSRKRNNRRRAQSGATRARSWSLARLNWPRIGVRMAALALIVCAGAALIALLDQPIERVTVTGQLQRVSAFDIEKIVRADLHGAGLVSVDLQGIGQGLKTLPWIDHAAVQRSWPRGLRVQITEQSAIARWNDNALLNARGELFASEARFAPPELPQLTGPVGSESEVASVYLASQGRLVEAGMRMVALALDARGAWTMTLDNGVTVRLGRDQMSARFDRFMLAAAKLVSQRANDINYVDMRYGNGFAVGWKGGSKANG